MREEGRRGETTLDMSVMGEMRRRVGRRESEIYPCKARAQRKPRAINHGLFRTGSFYSVSHSAK